MTVLATSLHPSANPAPGEPGSYSRQKGSSVGRRAQRGADTATHTDPNDGTRARQARFERYRLRYRLQAVQAWRTHELGEVAKLPSVSLCARTLLVTDGFGQAALMLGEDGRAGYAGVLTCSSVSACTVCSARIRNQRAREIEAAGVSWLRQGNHLGFGTLTLPHDDGEPLRATLDAVRGGWRYVQQDKAFREIKKAYGLRFVRAIEFTYTRAEQGGNGWHPHMHVLWFAEVDLTDDRLAALFSAIDAAWGSYIVEKLGRRRPTQLDLQAVEGRRDQAGLLRYLTKVQDGFDQAVAIGLEMARGDLKAGRKASRTPFEIAQGAVEGSVRDWRLWEEYATTTKGLRVIDKSKRLYADLGVQEVVDELAPDDGAGGYPVAFFDKPTWEAVVRAGAAAHLLDLAETQGRDAAQAALDLIVANETSG